MATLGGAQMITMEAFMALALAYGAVLGFSSLVHGVKHVAHVVHVHHQNQPKRNK